MNQTEMTFACRLQSKLCVLEQHREIFTLLNITVAAPRVGCVRRTLMELPHLAVLMDITS